MSRRVLIVQRPASPIELAPMLERAGWIAQPVFDPEALAAQAPRCTIGIAVLDDLAAFQRAGLLAAIAGSDVEWIGITPPRACDDPACARLLCGFFDYLTVPVDTDRLHFAIGHAHGKARLRKRHLRNDPHDGSHGMVGTSKPMQELYRTIDKVARVDAPVLISGESGTGKELAAHAIHRRSSRSAGPFIAVNCGAIPSTLIQSQLFGHEKGSFTSAHRRGIGSLEAAGGGTLFLDEIGDLPLEAQASLLRFLQESTITRVGSTEALNLDVRVVAATHVDLVAAVRERRFREDLYYRLNVLRVEMPPLRARPEDVEALARHVLARYRRDAPVGLLGFSESALAAMRGYAWPGNVRELVNRVHGAIILCESEWITAADLGLPRAERATGTISLAGARQSNERELVLAALQRNTHNVSATARELGVSRVTLYRLARRLSIETKAKADRPRERLGETG